MTDAGEIIKSGTGEKIADLVNKVEPVAAQPSLSPSLPPAATVTLDVVSKSVAAFAIVLYVCGFLILSIYHTSYGFFETNPLRPRIASAGAWFLLFTALPYLVIKPFQNSRYYKERDKLWTLTPILVFSYWLLCGAAGLYLLRWIFDISSNDPLASLSRIRFTHPVLAAVMIILGIAILIYVLLSKRGSTFGAIIALAIVTYELAATVHKLFISRTFDSTAIGLWLFCVGILMFLEIRFRSWSVTSRYWIPRIALMLGAVFVFGTFYYPHIKTSLGGGTPIPVTIYFTKDSIIKPSQSVTAFLIDESDSGLYIIGKSDKKATFIPRNAIGVVHFSDDPSDSSFFKKQ
ncbi:MAG: hypothetical protein WBX22_01515 [Silvibacterium sp.]